MHRSGAKVRLPTHQVLPLPGRGLQTPEDIAPAAGTYEHPDGIAMAGVDHGERRGGVQRRLLALRRRAPDRKQLRQEVHCDSASLRRLLRRWWSLSSSDGRCSGQGHSETSGEPLAPLSVLQRQTDMQLTPARRPVASSFASRQRLSQPHRAAPVHVREARSSAPIIKLHDHILHGASEMTQVAVRDIPGVHHGRPSTDALITR
mmetsp:Transcript_64698/g.142763  ORF Transcript_64698/g.142763 Transcript_64698/m.142763 type:complete len:204 (-) Transcript_64698:99-710(-)